MKNVLASLAAVCAIAFAGAAAAAPAGLYVQGSYGANYQANREDGRAFSVAVGKDFGQVRAEVEYLGTRNNDSLTLGNIASNTLNANVFYEPEALKVLGTQPFIGAGVGYGQLYRPGVVSGTNAVVFNAAVGASYPVSDKISIVTEYRYFLTNDAAYRKNVRLIDDYSATAATVGVRYAF